MDNPIKTVLLVLAVTLWIIAITDIINRRLKFLAFNFIWLMIVSILPIVGPLVYLFLRKGMRIDRPRKFDPKFQKLYRTK